MTYDLFIGDKTFSSWSLRGWLMLEKFDLAYREHMMGLYSGTMADDLAELAPARLVPVLRLPDGTVIGETLAMAETLAERHPEKAMWPANPTARAAARWLASAMTSGFGALRGDCPMQLQHANVGFEPSEAVRADLTRLEELWTHAAQHNDGNGPWLFGSYSLADVFYAPVCARIVGYDLPVSQKARAYCDTTIADPAFKKWRAAGLEKIYDPFPYNADLENKDWPTP